jgi:hypothetical protein
MCQRTVINFHFILLFVLSGLVVNKCVTTHLLQNFSRPYLRNFSTSEWGMFDYFDSN